ncbi:phenylalanine--tRNA ligase subunit alpha [Candidatus Marinimicrobia bacterium]|nr:phenylalanine--tRNA ligase subunit alpha [Candidatus Neomarinimicrobiota bacterium]
MQEQLESVRKSFLTDLESFPDNSTGLQDLKTKYLGRKGQVASLFTHLGKVDNADRPKFGQLLNLLKNELQSLYDKKELSISAKDASSNRPYIDITLPGRSPSNGSIHILEQTLLEIKEIFKSIGFNIAYGPEVDDDYHNFTALNVPEHHPSRDMQDTFFIDPQTVLRSHTSNVQIHLMETSDPPLRFIVPGRVYRNEAIGYKSYCLFHQVEGIYINQNVTFSQLKGCIEYFVKKMFGPKKKMRFRPSFFPFTEPSAEVDMWDDEKNQWMEILGCGMVDPAVISNVGYDPGKWKGFAFGMGVERIAMLKHKINDIRLFYNGDVRFSEQFS